MGLGHWSWSAGGFVAAARAAASAAGASASAGLARLGSRIYSAFITIRCDDCPGWSILGMRTASETSKHKVPCPVHIWQVHSLRGECMTRKGDLNGPDGRKKECAHKYKFEGVLRKALRLPSGSDKGLDRNCNNSLLLEWMPPQRILRRVCLGLAWTVLLPNELAM